MEPEGSLPSSQELSTCTYPEPDQSSPQHSLKRLYKAPIMDSLRCTLGWTVKNGLFFPPFHIPQLLLISCYIVLIMRDKANLTLLDPLCIHAISCQFFLAIYQLHKVLHKNIKTVYHKNIVVMNGPKDFSLQMPPFWISYSKMLPITRGIQNHMYLQGECSFVYYVYNISNASISRILFLLENHSEINSCQNCQVTRTTYTT
jgi:hypothetical protein